MSPSPTFRHPKNRTRTGSPAPAIAGRVLGVGSCGLALASVLVAAPCLAQDPVPSGGPASAYDLALARLDQGDTASAIDGLRALTRAHPDHGPAHLRLGTLLSAVADEVESRFRERREAELALRRAFELMPDDAEVLLEYGLLLRNKGMRTDAERVLIRAWQAAERKGRGLSPDRLGRFHYELGRIYETWWEDWQDLVMITSSLEPVQCGRLPGHAPHWDRSVLCPEAWARQSEHVTHLSHLKSDEHERLIGHFTAALAADPGQVDAAVRLLGHLADAGRWAEYLEAASRLAEAVPEDPRSHLFLGLGLHERGRDEEAGAAFRGALALLDPEERRVFDDVAPLLTGEPRAAYEEGDADTRSRVARSLFTGKDPLWLTTANEREVEHWARVAWTELKFSQPASGVRGWDTERGDIWIRYGRPWRSYQCCFADALGAGRRPGPARHLYWSYGEEGPVFVFEKRALTYRKARLTETAKAVADDLAASAPEAYRPRTLTRLHELPHQLARFRGERPELTRVEVYAAPPLDSLAVAPGARLQAGIFTFREDFTPVWNRVHTAAVRGAELGLTYLLELPPGRFRYGVEARLDAPDSLARPAARARGVFEAEGYPAGRLSVSDPLLAASIRPLTDAPVRRAELALAPLRSTVFPAGQPIQLYFEVYGLATDDAGLGAYAAELAVEDSTSRNVVERLLRGAGELLGRGTPETRVSWRRTVRVVEDVVPEYLTVEVPRLEAGDYVVRVRLRDERTGQEAESVRRFRVVAEEDP